MNPKVITASIAAMVTILISQLANASAAPSDFSQDNLQQFSDAEDTDNIVYLRDGTSIDLRTNLFFRIGRNGQIRQVTRNNLDQVFRIFSSIDLCKRHRDVQFLYGTSPQNAQPIPGRSVRATSNAEHSMSDTELYNRLWTVLGAPQPQQAPNENSNDPYIEEEEDLVEAEDNAEYNIVFCLRRGQYIPIDVRTNLFVKIDPEGPIQQVTGDNLSQIFRNFASLDLYRRYKGVRFFYGDSSQNAQPTSYGLYAANGDEHSMSDTELRNRLCAVFGEQN